jgi:hypothetical protein
MCAPAHLACEARPDLIRGGHRFAAKSLRYWDV